MAQVKMKPYFVLTLGIIFLLHLLSIFQSVNGAVKKKPYLTKEEHMKYSKFLKDEIKKKYPTDEGDDGEILAQECTDYGTLYKLTKEQEDCVDFDKVIFSSPGKKEVGKDVVVLMRGQDYFSPMNKERFVVLRQKGGGTEYSTHLATVKRDSKNKPTVTWDTVSITATRDASPLIEMAAKPFLVVGNWGSRKVPRCAWTGDVLLCEARKEPRKIGLKRAKKPKRRKPKPPYGKLPTPMPPFPPPPKKPGRKKIKDPFAMGDEGWSPFGMKGRSGQGGPEEYGSVLGGPGMERGSGVLGGPGMEGGAGVAGGPGMARGPGVAGGPGMARGPGVAGGPGMAGGKESTEEFYLMHKGDKPSGSLIVEKKGK